jgi:hypothetical protein
MPKFRMVLKKTEVVIQEYWEEFETTDEAAWKNLKNRIDTDKLDMEEIPEHPPADPAVWFALYKALYYAEYENQEEDDWISDRKGSTEYAYILSDEDGDEVMSD